MWYIPYFIYVGYVIYNIICVKGMWYIPHFIHVSYGTYPIFYACWICGISNMLCVWGVGYNPVTCIDHSYMWSHNSSSSLSPSPPPSSSSTLPFSVGDIVPPHSTISNSKDHFLCWRPSTTRQKSGNNILMLHSHISLSTKLSTCDTQPCFHTIYGNSNKVCPYI